MKPQLNYLLGVVPQLLVIIVGKQRVIFKFAGKSGSRSIRNSSIGVSAGIANATQISYICILVNVYFGPVLYILRINDKLWYPTK